MKLNFNFKLEIEKSDLKLSKAKEGYSTDKFFQLYIESFFIEEFKFRV